MILNEKEEAFIRQKHSEAGLEVMIDIRRLGAPAALYERIIEQRAAKISGKLAEFRSAQSAPTPQTNLEAEIEASKLF